MHTEAEQQRNSESHCSNRGHAEEVQFAEWPQDGAVGSVTLISQQHDTDRPCEGCANTIDKRVKDECTG